MTVPSKNDQKKKKAGGSMKGKTNQVVQSRFEPLNGLLQKWFYQPDLQAVRIALGAARTHFLNLGDPVWLFLVAPPGSGKTTMNIMATAGLPQVRMIGDLTPQTFLSGMHGATNPGILEQLGGEQAVENEIEFVSGNALFLLKDFTTVLSMRPDKKAEILAQLREIYDGQYTKSFGTGITKQWNGRVSILAAVTPIIDRHYSIFNTLGERFVQVRWHRPPKEAGIKARQQQGKESKINEELREAVQKLFVDSSVNGNVRTPPKLSEGREARIASFAEIIAIGRTHVYRDRHSRQIDFVPEPEANTRLTKELSALALGIASLEQRTSVQESELKDVFRVGLDCLPQNRRKIVVSALSGEEIQDEKRLNLWRSAEELVALGILESADKPYRLSNEIKELAKEAKLKV